MCVDSKPALHPGRPPGIVTSAPMLPPWPVVSSVLVHRRLGLQLLSKQGISGISPHVCEID